MSGYKDAIIDIMITMHHDASVLANIPNIFPDFLDNFKQASIEIKSKLTEIQEKYERGLDKLKNAKESVETFQADLDHKNPILKEKKKEIAEILEVYREQATYLENRRNYLRQEEKELHQEAEEASTLKEECRASLDKATPDIIQAIESLKQLSKMELSELKTMRKPPKAIKLLMSAVCIVIGEDPTRVKSKDGQKYIDDYWPTATGKRVLGNPKLLDILTSYGQIEEEKLDHNLNSDSMSKAEDILQNPDFEYKNIARACVAAKGLYIWIMALRKFYYISEEVKPKKEAYVVAEKQHRTKQEQMQQKKDELEELERNLLSYKTQLEDKENEVRNLEDSISASRIRKERAVELFEGLGGEEQKWLYFNRILAKQFFSVQADVLLGAGIMTYLRIFAQKQRDKMEEKWKELIRRYNLKLADDFKFNAVFGDQITIRQWVNNGLPSDNFSIQNAIILTRSSKYSICIDPQYQANKWIKIQESQKDDDEYKVMVLNYNDGQLIKSLELGLKLGMPVLVENIGNKLDLILHSICKKEYVNEGNSRSVNLSGHQVEVDDSFRLFLTSELRNPEFPPYIQLMVSTINFDVTLEGLESQMLSIVVSKEKAKLEEDRLQQSKEAVALIKELKEINQQILDALSCSVSEMLEDQNMIDTLHTSREKAEIVANNLNKVNKTTQKIEKAKAFYNPAAYRAAIMYFLVNDLQKIEYMYQFSLKWFISIFEEELGPRPDTSTISDQDRLLDIIRNFTGKLFHRVSQSIFEKDKLLFTFMLAFRILEGERLLYKPLYEFFVKGPQAVIEIKPSQTNNKPDETEENEN